MHAHDSPANSVNLSVVTKGKTVVLPTPKLELLPARSLILRPPYGRLPSSRRLASLRSNWMPAAIGTLSVARRTDGSTAVIDGTHRGTIAQETGVPDLVPCLIYEGLTLEEEAAAYLKLNNVLPQSALDLFHAEIEAGDANSIAINDAIVAAGLRMRTYRASLQYQPDNVACVMTIRAVAARYGIPHLAETLAFMSNVFDGQGGAINASTLPAFAGVLDAGNALKRFDRAHLHTVISEVGIAKLTGLAETVRLRTLAPRPIAFGIAIADLYNRGRRRVRLPRSPLAPLPKGTD